MLCWTMLNYTWAENLFNNLQKAALLETIKILMFKDVQCSSGSGSGSDSNSSSSSSSK